MILREVPVILHRGILAFRNRVLALGFLVLSLACGARSQALALAIG